MSPPRGPKSCRQVVGCISTGASQRWCGPGAVTAFVAAWLVAGAATPRYSPARQAISQLARIGAPHRLIMTMGFVIFGVGVPIFGRWLAHRLGGCRPVALCLGATGLSTLGVAVIPLTVHGSATQDRVHAVFAVASYVSLAATPLFAARPLVRAGRSCAAALSVLTGVASALALAWTSIGPQTGLFQRLGLTVVDIWLVMMAAWPRGNPPPSQVASAGGA